MRLMTLADLRAQNGMTLQEMAVRLGCSKSHVHDLITGRRSVTTRIARRLEEMTGRPWHEWVSTPTETAA